MRSCVLLLTIALLAASASAQTWPTLPVSYTATVSANFHDANPQNCYTLAYTEAVDNTTGAFSVQGRSRGSSNAVELYFSQSGIVFTYNSVDPSNTCAFYAFSSIPAQAQRMIGSHSTSLFSMFDSPSANKTYLGQSTEARTILCDKWQVDIAFGFGGNTRVYTATVYFAVAGTSGLGEAVPVRVELYSPNATAAQSVVSHTYDWVNFVPGVPPATLFTLPNNCQQGSFTRNGGRFPTANPLPSDPADPVMPSLPKQFSATAEVKLETAPASMSLAAAQAANATAVSVYTVVWSMDAVNYRARYDYYSNENAALKNSKTIVSSYIYQYDPSAPWGSRGTAWMSVYNATSKRYSTQCQMMTGELTGQYRSPLMNIRAGSLPTAFANPAAFFTPPHMLLNTSALARGVNADVYRGAHSVNTIAWRPSTSSPTDWVQVPSSFAFTSDFMFFPKGWAFPGRDTNETAGRIPLRVQNSGTESNATGAYAYQDTWDLFLMVPVAPQEARFDPTAIGCPLAPTAAPITPTPAPTTVQTMINTLTSTNSAGAWIGGILIGALLAGAAACVWRWRMIRAREAEQLAIGSSDINLMPKGTPSSSA